MYGSNYTSACDGPCATNVAARTVEPNEMQSDPISVCSSFALNFVLPCFRTDNRKYLQRLSSQYITGRERTVSDIDRAMFFPSLFCFLYIFTFRKQFGWPPTCRPLLSALTTSRIRIYVRQCFDDDIDKRDAWAIRIRVKLKREREKNGNKRNSTKCLFQNRVH